MEYKFQSPKAKNLTLAPQVYDLIHENDNRINIGKTGPLLGGLFNTNKKAFYLS
jgi:hypothetical protein